jgi:TIGR03009 family protein
MHLKPHSIASLAFVFCWITPAVAQTQYPPQGAANGTVQSVPASEPAATPDLSQASTLGTPLAQVTSVPAVPSADGTTPTPPAQPAALGPPFQLNETDQAYVDQILQMWENTSKEIKTFDSPFERWEYDPVFGPAGVPFIKSKGQLSYSKPDKGSFKINDIQRYLQKDPAQPGTYEPQKQEVGEHWVCDGKAIFQYNHEKKQLVVSPLPEHMRGQAIVDGPLPFLFGAEADKLKARYWIRCRESTEKQIWLEAFPRTQEDAANYHHVDVMLNRKTMMPAAIQVHMPNGRNSSVYMFNEKPNVNGALDALFGSLFSSPRTPLGWTRVVEEPPTAPQATQPPTTQLK